MTSSPQLAPIAVIPGQLPPLPPTDLFVHPQHPQQQHPQHPQQQHPQHPQQHHHAQHQYYMNWNGTDTMPHISNMLVREAEAWKVIMNLHGSVVATARTVPDESSDIDFYEAREATAQREVSYLAALSQLCASCDCLVAEATKIRGLRKAKHHLEKECVKEIIRGHADEVLALGDASARNSSLTFAAITSELRSKTQAIKAQLTQARGLMNALNESRELKLPHGAQIVIGVRHEDGSTELKSTEEILTTMHSSNKGLEELLIGAPAAPPQLVRTFARRASAQVST